METPNIRGLGITQDRFSRRWKATGSIEHMGWIEAWGATLVEAMEALQTRAARRVAEQSQPGKDA
jgi:hypothetical protein